MPSHPLRPDAWIAGLLACAGGALVLGWRAALGLWGGLGTDAPLWGLTALDLADGNVPLVPPLYPALVALWPGGTLVESGAAVSLIASALVPAAVFGAARVAGADRGFAAIAAVFALLIPDLCGMAQQLQPDSLTALALVGLGGLLAGSVRADRVGWACGWGAAALAGVLPMLREHGLPAAIVAGLVLALTPGPRGGRLMLLVGLALGIPLIMGWTEPAHPLRWPWADRGADALAVLLHPTTADAPYASTLGRQGAKGYYDLLAAGDRLGIGAFHARRGLALAGDGWLVLGAALGAALALRRRPLLALCAPLLSALPALILWSQRRHALVAVPLALAALGAMAGAGRAARGIALALCGIATVSWVRMWPALAAAQPTEVLRAGSLAEVGAWLADNAPTDSLLGGVIQDVGLYHPMLRHDPDGSAADWRTFLVAERPPLDPRWTEVFRGRGLSVFQLDPAREPRPCADATVASGARHLVVATAHAELVPGASLCDIP